MLSSDILVLKTSSEQEAGNVYVIGDVHGEIRAFKAVLKRLTPLDTLIIAGDLIDRGQDESDKPASSLILDELIILKQADKGSTPQIHVIKGNHEKDFLDLIDLLSGDNLNTEANVASLLRIIKNGGAWIFKDIDSVKTQTLEAWSNHYSFNTEHATNAELYLTKFVVKLLSSKDNTPYLIDKIKAYAGYVRSLPYIIKIDDPLNPAWVAHADLPMTDKALNEKIKAGTSLTADEISAVTDTRPGGFSTVRQGNSSVKVYCGHNILSDNPEKDPNPTHAVRADTQHYNLDAGAYFSGSFIAVNHTKSLVDIISDGSRPIPSFIKGAKKEISRYLTARKPCIEQTDPGGDGLAQVVQRTVSLCGTVSPESSSPSTDRIPIVTHCADNDELPGKLMIYIQKRTSNTQDLYRWRSMLSLFSNQKPYEKNTKLEAAKKLLKYAKNKFYAPFTKDEVGALKDGELSKIAKEYISKIVEIKTNNGIGFKSSPFHK